MIAAASSPCRRMQDHAQRGCTELASLNRVCIPLSSVQGRLIPVDTAGAATITPLTVQIRFS